MKNNLNCITELLQRTKGVDVSRFDDAFLTKCIERRMTEYGCDTKEHYSALLEQNEVENDTFLNSLQISYTEFFRNSLTFSVLEKLILPGLFLNMENTHQHELRIWSAACASGQETYSLSMLLNECSTGKKKSYRIFATDKSEKQIEVAKKGIYPVSALNYLTQRRLDDWFIRNEKIYEIKPVIKEHIEFTTFDLLSNEYSCPPTSIFGYFDIIMCANMLFYYNSASRKIIIEKLSSCLSENGVLITGETEREILIKYKFEEVIPHSAIFSKKNNSVCKTIKTQNI